MVEGWLTDWHGEVPCCGERLSVMRQPGTDPDMADPFGCPECGSLLRFATIDRALTIVLAAPCDVCDLNGVPTEGPLCRHCHRCEEDCDGGEYPEESPDAHEFEPVAEAT